MIEKIDLEWIKSFVYFAESAGVEEAASKLGLTQPAITQHLAKLDSALPHSLFERRGKRKALSEYGRKFYIDLSKELRIIEDLLRASKFESAKEKDVTIRLGLNKDIYYRICDKIEFGGQLEVYNQRSADAVQALLKREVDIAVGRVAPDSGDVIATKWYSDCFVIIYPKSWDKDFRNGELKDNLSKRNFILNNESPGRISEVLISMGLPPQDLSIQHKLTDWYSILKLVQDGRGWSIVPSSFELSPKIQSKAVPSKGLHRTQFYILYHKTVRNFPGFQNLLISMLASMK